MKTINRKEGLNKSISKVECRKEDDVLEVSKKNKKCVEKGDPYYETLELEDRLLLKVENIKDAGKWNVTVTMGTDECKFNVVVDGM